MTTATDIITDAYGKLGVYSPSDTITSFDMTTAFNCLNDLLDNWSNQSLAAFANADNSFPLVGGQNQYTIGAGGQVNITRPLRLLDAPNSAYVVDVNNNVYPVTVIDQNTWNSISSRNISGTWPTIIFYDPQYPLALLNCWPTPQSGYTLHFTSRIPFVDAANQSSTITLPPGYVIALKYGLAQELIPYFPEQAAGSAPFVIKMAAKTLADLKRTNVVIPFATFDSGIAKGSPPYSIYTDRSV